MIGESIRIGAVPSVVRRTFMAGRFENVLVVGWEESILKIIFI